MPKKVVFILGAGSSCMYGRDKDHLLPTAKGLNQLLFTSKSYNILKPPPNEHCLPADFQSRRNIICDIFAKSGNYSIDRFLERRNDFEREGKRIIADCLLPLELGALQTITIASDWYQWLFNQLYIPSKKTLHTNNLSLITFNYDRTLEFALYTMLFHNTARLIDDVRDLVNALNIIHVYGSLQSPIDYDHSTRTWNCNISSLDVHNSAKDMLIISNAREEQGAKKLTDARKAVNEADVLVLLGFGFDPENMKRIGLESAPRKFGLNEIGQLDIFASAFHVDERERDDASHYLRNVTIAARGNTTRTVSVGMGEYEHGCEKFLRRYVSLRSLLEVPD